MTGEKEYDLMCPNNPIGPVDLFMASNHGSNNANMPFFIRSMAPRVSIAQNNPGKGASVQYLQALQSVPGFIDTWLLHWGNAAGAEWNPPGAFIANGVEPATIAAALIAPPPAPRGGGGGRGGAAGGAAAPAAGAPAVGAATPAAPAATGAPAAPAPPAAGAPQAPAAGAPPAVAGAPAGGGGRGGGQPPHTPAHYIKVSVQADGTFTVWNSRNNFSKTYAPRARTAK
jgi:hypothetical protein